MGYVAKRRIYKLTFAADDELAGLEIKCQAPTMGEALELTELGEESMNDLRPQMEMFVKYIVSWNFETETGEPIPVSVDHLLTLEAIDFYRVMESWEKAVSGPDAPLAQPSTDGVPFPAGSMPMATLSASQAS